jgi:hypothetical protein
MALTTKQLSALIVQHGITLNEFVQAHRFGCTPEQGEREEAIRNLAVDLPESLTEKVSIDGDAVVSEGDDNGAYVLAWLWVPFEGTPFDKGLGDAEYCAYLDEMEGSGEVALSYKAWLADKQGVPA